MDHNFSFIPLEPTPRRPVRIDTILAARLKHLRRARRRQLKRQQKQPKRASDER